VSDNKRYISQSEYADHRGVSRSTVSQYKKENKLVMTEDSKVDVVQSDNLLASVLDSRGGDRSSSPKKASPKSSKLADEKLRGEQIKNARMYLRLEKDAGRLGDMDSVYRAAFETGRASQEALLSIPARICNKLALETDPNKIEDLLTAELILVCNQLSEYAKGLQQ